MPTPINVLIVEDNPDDAELMAAELRRGGFDPRWRRVDTEPEYLAGLDPGLSVILADYNLPQFDAMRALELLQERGLDIPFLIVSGAIGEEVAVAAMKRGAADYLLKDRLARLAPAVEHTLNAKRLRDEKRHAEQMYREIFENAVEGIYRSTPQGRFLAVNPSLSRILGYSSPQEAMAAIQDINTQLHASPERAAELALLLEEADSVRGFECQFLDKDGSAIWVSLNVRAVRDEMGALIHLSGSVQDITEIRAHQAAVRQYQQDLRDLAARLIQVQELEGKRLSRELHDVFSQKLAALGIELGLLRTKPPDSPAVFKERLEKISGQVTELATSIQQTSRRLHPAVLEDLGLSVALANECVAFQEMNGIQVRFRCPRQPASRMPKDVSLCLYRVSQESLWNIRKHAQATRVHVTLRDAKEGIVLIIQDDGRGFVRDQIRGKGGLGLIAMEERVRLVGGSLSVISEPGRGTRVEVRVSSAVRGAGQVPADTAPAPL